MSKSSPKSRAHPHAQGSIVRWKQCLRLGLSRVPAVRRSRSGRFGLRPRGGLFLRLMRPPAGTLAALGQRDPEDALASHHGSKGRLAWVRIGSSGTQIIRRRGLPDSAGCIAGRRMGPSTPCRSARVPFFRSPHLNAPAGLSHHHYRVATRGSSSRRLQGTGVLAPRASAPVPTCAQIAPRRRCRSLAHAPTSHSGSPTRGSAGLPRTRCAAVVLSAPTLNSANTSLDHDPTPGALQRAGCVGTMAWPSCSVSWPPGGFRLAMNSQAGSRTGLARSSEIARSHAVSAANGRASKAAEVEVGGHRRQGLPQAGTVGGSTGAGAERLEQTGFARCEQRLRRRCFT
jgi:hypothetical protein